MSDDTTPSPGLREQIAQALVAEHHRRTRQGLLTSPEIHNTALADAVMLVVQPALSQRDAELRRLHTLFDEAQESLPIEQRRLLSISRMVFDRHAEGDTLGRDEAADLAQRIVDEIGHSVTEEPALGPSFRVEIAELKATLASLAEVFESAGNALAGAPDDWSETRGKAWMWGLFCGWDCKQAHEHDPDTDPTCIFALDEIAAKHGWSPELVARLRQLRSTVAAVDQPADSKEA